MCGRSRDEALLHRHHKTYEYDSGQTSSSRKKECVEHPERFSLLCTRCHNWVTYGARLPKQGKMLGTKLIRHDPTSDFRYAVSKQRRKVMSVKRKEGNSVEDYITGKSERLPVFYGRNLETSKYKKLRKVNEYLRDPDEEFHPYDESFT